MIDSSVTQAGNHPSATDSGAQLGCILAMRVMQSPLYRQLDDEERAECDELVARWCDILKRQVESTASETATSEAAAK